MSHDKDGDGQGVAEAPTRECVGWHRPRATQSPGWRAAGLLRGLFVAALSLAGFAHAQAVEVQNTLISKGLPSDTGNGSSSAAALSSADGRYVVFSSRGGNFVPGIVESNSLSDVFLHDRTTQQTILVSRSATSPTSTANGSSFATAISADGEWVLFRSSATNLVPGLTNSNGAGEDVFLYQRSSGSVILVSRSATSATTTANTESTPTAISADGEWVLFRSRATDLVSGITDSNGLDDVFVYQRSTGAVTLVSRSATSATTTANVRSFPTAISADGEWVLFSSRATNLVAGVTDSNATDDVFVYQRSAGAVSLVSRSAASTTTTANGSSFPTAISADGEWVLFLSSATDLASGVTDTNGTGDVFLHQRSTGAVSLVSRAAGSATTAANSLSQPTAISADGGWVLFQSLATNLVPGVTDNNATDDAFLYQRSTGAVSLVSRSAASATTTANSSSFPSTLSADGEWVLFRSAAVDLVSGGTDSNGFAEDVFLYQRSTAAVSLVSRSAAVLTTTSNNASTPTAISADGEWVLFQSLATNLVSGVTDNNATDDVFLYQRSAGAVSLVSRAVASLVTTADDASLPSAISADGEWVLFRSTATDLMSGVVDINGTVDAFLYRRSTRAVSLVSRASESVTMTANDASFPITISADGEWVLLQSRATNLVSGVVDSNGAGEDVFLCQRSTGAVSLVSRAAASATTTGNTASFPAAISADGEWVLFQSRATNLLSGVTDGNATDDVFLYQRSTGAVTLVSRSGASATTTGNNASFPTAISADGEWVLFQSRATNLVSGVTDSNGTVDDVFLYQRSTGAVSLVSRAGASATTTANNLSFPAAISADGVWVMFYSAATNLVSGVTDSNGNLDTFLYQRGTGDVSLVSRSSASATTTANFASIPRAISADGEWVLFQSNATNLMSGVTNGNGSAEDVFLYQRSTGAVSLVSRSATSATTTANFASVPRALSGDGEWALFQSLATDLVDGVTDSNGFGEDVFLYQRSTGAVSLVSRSAASATTTASGLSQPSSISADGKWVLFFGSATDVASGVVDNNGADDTFLARVVDPDQVFGDGFESVAPVTSQPAIGP